jgi:hypothetical protein
MLYIQKPFLFAAVRWIGNNRADIEKFVRPWKVQHVGRRRSCLMLSKKTGRRFGDLLLPPLPRGSWVVRKCGDGPSKVRVMSDTRFRTEFNREDGGRI